MGKLWLSRQDGFEKHNNPTIRPQRDIDKPKHSPTIMLAGHGRQYKSTIVKLMNDDPHLSKDRHTRVRYKEMQPEGLENMETSKCLVLFHDYAVIEGNTFGVARIVRMINKCSKRKVEYKNPIEFGDECIAKLELTCLAYMQSSHTTKFDLDEKCEMKTIMASKVLCHVNLTCDNLLNTYKLPEAGKQTIDKPPETEKQTIDKPPETEKQTIDKEVTKMITKTSNTRRTAPAGVNDKANTIHAFNDHFQVTIAPSTS